MRVINLVSIPGMGIDLYLQKRYGPALACIDARLVDDVTRSMQTELRKEGAIVAVTRLDRVKLTEKFFVNLRKLAETFDENANLYLSTNLPITDLCMSEMKYNHSAISETEYIKPLSFSEYKSIRPNTTKKNFEMCGGHLHLIESLKEGQATPLTKRISEELADWYKEFIALSKPTNQTLKDMGWFVNEQAPSMFIGKELGVPDMGRLKSLRPMEQKLYNFLKLHNNEVATKDEIIQNIWGEDKLGEVSDWAVNALVYRLRNSGALLPKEKIINHKKIGYELFDAFN